VSVELPHDEDAARFEARPTPDPDRPVRIPAGQLEGIAAAKAKGVYKGRPAKIDAAKVAALKAEGLGPTEISKRLGVGRASVYRILGAAAAA
jgi:DNA invertase Pin-like site-specific DNA recombinase